MPCRAGIQIIRLLLLPSLTLGDLSSTKIFHKGHHRKDLRGVAAVSGLPEKKHPTRASHQPTPMSEIAQPELIDGLLITSPTTNPALASNPTSIPAPITDLTTMKTALVARTGVLGGIKALQILTIMVTGFLAQKGGSTRSRDMMTDIAVTLDMIMRG